MATMQVTPAPSQLSQLRAALGGRFAQKVWQYTVRADGTVVLHGAMMGTLRDVARLLEKEGVLQ